MKRATKTLLALLAVVGTIGFLWSSNRPVPARMAGWDDVVTEARRGGYQLIRTEEVWAEHQREPKSMFLVDTRQEWEYRTGHIAGALNFPLEPTWSSRLWKRGDLRAFLGSDKDRFIVFY